MSNLKDKKLFLLDMDGTIYLDNDVFDGTLDFLDRVRAIGGKYLFVTNNSSKSVDAYVNKLNKLGIEADESNFLTSTDATILYLETNYPGKRFYAMGTKSFIKQLKDAKIDEKAIRRQEAIIKAMTKREREKPDILNASRKKRIAAGSGTTVEEVNKLLKQFEQIRMLMKQFSDPKKLSKLGKGKMKIPF